MAITQQMVLLRMEDIVAFAEARTLVRLARELVDSARRDDARRALADLHVACVGVAATVAEALRAGEPRTELRRLRDACLALGEVRGQAWDAHAAAGLATARFDDLMATTARCLREVLALEVAVRRRARRRLDEEP